MLYLRIHKHKKKEKDMLTEGLKETATVQVSAENTALTMGSGDMPVFATPAMVALMENAAMRAVADELPDGCTTVGGYMEASHLAPSPLGVSISAEATLTEVKGRKLTFSIEARQEEKVIGKATHIRFIVGRKEFMEKMARQ